MGFELMDVCVWVGNLYMVFEMRFWDLARILVLVWKGRCCRMWERDEAGACVWRRMCLDFATLAVGKNEVVY